MKKHEKIAIKLMDTLSYKYFLSFNNHILKECDDKTLEDMIKFYGALSELNFEELTQGLISDDMYYNKSGVISRCLSEITVEKDIRKSEKEYNKFFILIRENNKLARNGEISVKQYKTRIAKIITRMNKSDYLTDSDVTKLTTQVIL